MDERLNINEREITLIKKTFCENEYLLKAIRALFLNLGVTDEEKSAIKATFSDKELLALMHKKFYPQLDKDASIGTTMDVWMGVEQMVFGKGISEIYQAVQYKDEALKMTKKALALLENPDGEKIDVTFDPALSVKDDYQIRLLARNQFIKHVESQLMFLMIIAGKKDETVEQTTQRLTKNSSK